MSEQIGDEVRVSPRPGPAHSNAAAELGSQLRGPFQFGRGGPGGWIILIEPELHLVANRPVVPDLAAWRRERLPVVPRAAAIRVAPDWVCEILSPSTAVWDRSRKLPFYAQHEVGHVWLLDPLAPSLEVFRRSGAHWTLLGTYDCTESLRAEPFQAIELELRLLWQDLEPAPSAPAEGEQFT